MGILIEFVSSNSFSRTAVGCPRKLTIVENILTVEGNNSSSLTTKTTVGVKYAEVSLSLLDEVGVAERSDDI